MSQGFKELLLLTDSLIRTHRDPQPTLCSYISCPLAGALVPSPSSFLPQREPVRHLVPSLAGPVDCWLAVWCSS